MLTEPKDFYISADQLALIQPRQRLKVKIHRSECVVCILTAWPAENKKVLSITCLLLESPLKNLKRHEILQGWVLQERNKAQGKIHYELWYAITKTAMEKFLKRKKQSFDR